jgi:hypothetical protein
MSCTTVKTQAELDAALTDKAADCIHINSPKGVWITIAGVTPGKTYSIEGESSIRGVWGSASISGVRGSASISGVRDSASIRDVRGSASISAHGNANVHAYDNVTVTAGPHVAVHLHSKTVRVTGGVVIDVTDVDLKDAPTWAGHMGAEVVDGRVTLYKALGDDLTAGYDYGRPTVYQVGTDVTAEDWTDNHNCGGGLHLSPRTSEATAYHSSATRWLRCTADLADIRPILDGGAAKAKCRTVRVEAEVDAVGREIQPAEATS